MCEHTLFLLDLFWVSRTELANNNHVIGSAHMVLITHKTGRAAAAAAGLSLHRWHLLCCAAAGGLSLEAILCILKSHKYTLCVCVWVKGVCAYFLYSWEMIYFARGVCDTKKPISNFH